MPIFLLHRHRFCVLGSISIVVCCCNLAIAIVIAINSFPSCCSLVHQNAPIPRGPASPSTPSPLLAPSFTKKPQSPAARSALPPWLGVRLQGPMDLSSEACQQPSNPPHAHVNVFRVLVPGRLSRSIARACANNPRAIKREGDFYCLLSEKRG